MEGWQSNDHGEDKGLFNSEQIYVLKPFFEILIFT